MAVWTRSGLWSLYVFSCPSVGSGLVASRNAGGPGCASLLVITVCQIYWHGDRFVPARHCKRVTVARSDGPEAALWTASGSLGMVESSFDDWMNNWHGRLARSGQRANRPVGPGMASNAARGGR